MARRMHRALAVVGVAAGASLAPVLAAVLAPTAAWGAYTGSALAPLTASTYAIPAPASVDANFVCAPNGRQATVTVLGYAKVSRATAYTFTLTGPSGASTSTTTTLDVVTLTQPSSDAGNRVYTLTVQARIGTWIGASLTRSQTCG